MRLRYYVIPNVDITPEMGTPFEAFPEDDFSLFLYKPGEEPDVTLSAIMLAASTQSSEDV